MSFPFVPTPLLHLPPLPTLHSFFLFQYSPISWFSSLHFSRSVCFPFSIFLPLIRTCQTNSQIRRKNINLSFSGLCGCFPLNAFSQSLVIYLFSVDLDSKFLLSSCCSFLVNCDQQQFKFPKA